MLRFFWQLFSWKSRVYVWRRKNELVIREEKSDPGYPCRSNQNEKHLLVTELWM
jgi:hypothetical protein